MVISQFRERETGREMERNKGLGMPWKYYDILFTLDIEKEQRAFLEKCG